jgi:hypothetical protein
MERPTFYRTAQIDGLSIFYREAGPKDAPTLLLLHGLPSSSRMFEPLFARLADRYHLVAPDYPGFGHNDWPDPKKFAYTFDHCAEIMNHFTEALGLFRYTAYMQDLAEAAVLPRLACPCSKARAWVSLRPGFLDLALSHSSVSEDDNHAPSLSKPCAGNPTEPAAACPKPPRDRVGKNSDLRHRGHARPLDRQITGIGCFDLLVG